MRKLFLLFLLIPTALHAFTITARVDSPTVNLEDEILLTLSLEGDSEASQPVLPSMPAFKIIASGASSNITIINGQMSVQKDYNYTLIPQEAGTFEIPPISVFSKGKEYKSEPIKIQVQKHNVPAGVAPVLPQGSEEGRDYWITTTVNKKEAYAHEEILFTFRFFTKIQIGQAELKEPEFVDFWSDILVPEKKYYSTINGVRHVVSEKVYALYPLSSGDLTISETELNVQVPSRSTTDPFDDFFGFSRQQASPKHLTSPFIPIKVLPLPEAPKDYVNLVGKFGLSVTLSQEEVGEGDSATLEITLSGHGNIKDAVLPDIKLDDFKIYDDKPTLEISRKENGIFGKKIFKKALVPKHSGLQTIPTFSLTYFDPETGAYETLESPELKLNVTGSEPLEEPVKNNPRENREEITGIHTDPELFQNLPISYPPLIGWVILLVLPMGLTVFLLVFGQIKKRRFQNADYRRYKQARRSFLKKVQSFSLKPQASLLLEAIKDYIGDRCLIPGRALTVLEMEKILSLQIRPNDVSDLLSLVRMLEASVYGGRALEVGSLLVAKNIVDRIDPQIKEGP